MTLPESAWGAFRRETSGYPLRAFLICLIGVSLENMDQAFFSFVLPQLSKDLQWSVVERGWYLTLTFTLAGLSIAGLGVLTDRLGRKRVFSAWNAKTASRLPICVARVGGAVEHASSCEPTGEQRLGQVAEPRGRTGSEN